MDVFLQARQAVEFYDDVMDGLQELSFHFRLGALTNGNADLERVLVPRICLTQYNMQRCNCQPSLRRICF